MTLANTTEIWLEMLPRPMASHHKYSRGYALTLGGDMLTGASRLAALAALRIGAGASAIACSRASFPIYAASLLSVIVKPADTAEEWRDMLSDERYGAMLAGPGAGRSETTAIKTQQMLRTGKPCVIDADALSVFEGEQQNLFDLLHAGCVLTPHEGEFARLFSEEGEREERAQLAAQESGAVVVLKGSQTVIASAGGRLVVNHNAPPWLATAGSGDVLAGMIVGLIAQGMPAFEAACAAVWIHGEAANRLKLGMIAEDLLLAIPTVLQTLIEPL